MRSWGALLLENLELRKPPAHLFLRAGRRHPTSQYSTELRQTNRVSYHEAIQRHMLPTYQCAHATETKDPRDAVLAVERGVALWATVRVPVDDAEDHARRDRDLANGN